MNETLLSEKSEQPLIVQLLLGRGLLEEQDLAEVQQALSAPGTPEEALIRANLTTDADIVEVYSQQMHLPVVGQDAPLEVNKDLAELVGERVCREKLVVPLSRQDGTLVVAMGNPTDLTTLEQIQLVTGLVIDPVVAPVMAINEALATLFGKRDFVKEIASEARAAPQQPQAREDEAVEEVVDLDRPLPKGRDGHVIRLVNHVLSSAIAGDASDVHIEPFENSVKIRIRIDGQLQEISPPPKAMYVPVISRLKVLAKMDIAERRVPQDGAIALSIADKRVDLRVSTVPTVYGEKMVLRILSKGLVCLDLTKLGFSPKQAEDFRAAADSPHGLLLVTGPTGSGKSTTLYATLNLLNRPNVNVMTVEDPVEYKFEGLNQVQVRSQVGLTFASALRAFLRQDPDVIMVGEVRDQETAQICLRAALTGHMVLSTLHTNDALAAVSRLVEAQRLVRRLCPECKEAYRLDAATAGRWNLDPDREYFRPKGCPVCRGGGYKGRVGLFEVLRVTNRLRDAIAQNRPLPELREEARSGGVVLLVDAGIQKVWEGVTSLEEVLAACMGEDE